MKTKHSVMACIVVVFGILIPYVHADVQALDVLNQEQNTVSNVQVSPSNAEYQEVDQGIQKTMDSPESITPSEAPLPLVGDEPYVLLPNEVIVYNFETFKSIIEDPNNGTTTIYLGSNIDMTTFVTISDLKANITIDGTDPSTGIRYTLTEYNTTLLGYEIYLNSSPATPATITMRNISIHGYNYYGTINLYDTVQDTIVRYDNVTYVGPQMMYNRRGTAEISNCNITILAQGSPAQEVAEAKIVILEGKVVVDHTTPATFNVFGFEGGYPGTVVLKKGANIEIKTNISFAYGPYSYTQEENSTMQITQASTGGSIFTGNGYNYDFTLKDGSVFELNQAYTGATGPMFHWYSPNSNLILIGATMRLKSEGTRNNDMMYVGKASLVKSNITIDVPTAFSNSLYNSGGNSTLYMEDSSIQATVEGIVSSASGVLIYNSGTVTMIDSIIDLKANNTVAGNVISLGNCILVSSKILTEIHGDMANTSALYPAIKLGTLVLDESTLDVKVMGTSGYLLSYNGPLVVDEGSRINLNSNNSVSPLLNITGDLTIQNGGELNIDLNKASSSSASSIYTNANLTFGKDSVVKLITRQGSNAGLITMTGINKTINFTDPKAIVLFGPSSSDKLISNTYALTYSIHAQQINQWNTATTYEATGGFSHLPQYEFKKKDATQYTIQGTLAGGSSGATTVTASNHIEEDGVNPSGTFSFNASTTKVLSMGALEISLQTPLPTGRDTTIGGFAPSGSTVKLIYKSNAQEYTLIEYADETGKFEFATLPLDQEDFSVEVYHVYRYQRISATPLTYVGQLRFVDVPSLLAFETSQIPAQTMIIPRIKSNWSLSIEDDRFATSSWTLSAKILSQLTPSDESKPKILNAFVFIEPDGTKHTLSTTTPTLIQSSLNGPTLTNVSWAATKGLLIEVNPGAIYRELTYTGSIEWTLISAP